MLWKKCACVSHLVFLSQPHIQRKFCSVFLQIEMIYNDIQSRNGSPYYKYGSVSLSLALMNTYGSFSVTLLHTFTR